MPTSSPKPQSPAPPCSAAVMRWLVALLALAATAAAATVQCPEGWVELTEADLDTTVAASSLTILQAGWQQ